jgi:phosphomevalonate kinase
VLLLLDSATTMTTTPSTTTTVSAPGKVLLAGGYLVLESPNVGLVIATDKRFFCTIERNQREEDADADKKSTKILVRSPQFHSEWTYEASVDEERQVYLTPDVSNNTENGFIEKTLRVTLAYLWSATANMPSSIVITIRADNDFYSVLNHLEERDWPKTPHSVESLPKFLPCPLDADGKPVVRKTGLGSSAALVTSLVGALLQSANLYSLERAHNLSQLCHCHAQGKVGSGFDVSAAVYGSHVYTRFDKSILEELLQDLSLANETISGSTLPLLKQVVDSKWQGGVLQGLDLPEGLHLLLADVCGGSESPSMAKKVLAWKTDRNAEKETYWEKLQDLNLEIVKLVQSLTPIDCVHDSEVIRNLKETFRKTRNALKQMGDAAHVPIEPPSQTELCNATEQIEGVVTTLVPGAGGYDALACLYVGHVRNEIGELWASWNHNDTQVCPLAVQAARYGQGLFVETSFSME